MAKQPVQHNDKDHTQHEPELVVKLSEIRSNHFEIEGFNEKSNHSLYQMLAKIVGFIHLSRTEEGQQIFTDMCKELGINNRDNADLLKNEFLPHFRLLFQKKQKDKIPSTIYKWCQVVRYLVEHEVSEKDTVNFINDFTWKNKPKLLGLILADSNNHPTNRGRYNVSIEDRLYKLMRQTEDNELSVIEVEETPPTVEKLCLVLGEVDKTGKVVLRKFYDREDLATMLVKFLPKKKNTPPQSSPTK